MADIITRLSNLAERWELLVAQGRDFGPINATMLNPDESPVNLTGATIAGSIKRRASDSTTLAMFDVAITDAAAGEYSFGLSAAVTADLTGGTTVYDPASLYVADLLLTDSLGRKLALYHGTLKVEASVTP